jgi:hypothetical protein
LLKTQQHPPLQISSNFNNSLANPTCQCRPPFINIIIFLLLVLFFCQILHHQVSFK